ncbi:DUF1289 domain-containing protein [Methylopila sp. M107]|uniref:DUF1289 domain-containing protein n=1 Tax=Methylopila sp. M107 TaxID=1101190 RepID=UPI000381812A|nr:DUF1289 domain-containing protein [Methylopila sp. M107]
MASRPIKSPCVQVCVVDPANGWCEGCYRTLAEIGGWMRYSDAERDRVIATLGARRRVVRDGPPRRESDE